MGYLYITILKHKRILMVGGVDGEGAEVEVPLRLAGSGGFVEES
jgi:hypothetical protein